MRNRICHSEAIRKPRFLNLKPGENWSHAAQALRKIGEEFKELLGWFSPELLKAYMNSSGWDWFNKICITAAVRSFKDDCSKTGLLAPIVDPNPPCAATTAFQAAAAPAPATQAAVAVATAAPVAHAVVEPTNDEGMTDVASQALGEIPVASSANDLVPPADGAVGNAGAAAANTAGLA